MGESILLSDSVQDDPVILISHWVMEIAVVIMLGLFVTNYVGSLATVSGRSMEDTLYVGDVVLVNRMIVKISSPKRKDVILYEKTNGEKDVKRIIGLPGERIRIVQGQILINDELLDDLRDTQVFVPGLAAGEITLGKDEYFLLGDWVEGSLDSRFAEIGNIKREQILGRIWFCISPMDHIGWVEEPETEETEK